MHLHRRARAALLLCSIVCSTEALTSQTHLMSRPLTDVVRNSDVVVVAVPADPPTRLIPIDITPKGQRPDAKKWPPYTRVLYRFTVKAVISDRARDGIVVPATSPKLKPDVVIEVDTAQHGSDLWLHRSY